MCMCENILARSVVLWLGRDHARAELDGCLLDRIYESMLNNYVWNTRNQYDEYECYSSDWYPPTSDEGSTSSHYD